LAFRLWRLALGGWLLAVGFRARQQKIRGECLPEREEHLLKANGEKPTAIFQER
jgi:hypothetical protein